MKKNNFQEVKKIFDSEMKALYQVIDAFPWDNKEAYALWLGQSYYMVRHTTRFASYTASRIGFDDESLHRHLLQHLREETGHEMLAYNDFSELGYSVDEIPESMETKLLLQGQYYWIGQTPYAHYGFIWVLETIATQRGQAMIKKVQKAFGPDCSTFLSVHAEVDQDHAAEIFEVVQKFDPNQYQHVMEVVKQTCFLYSQMLRQIIAVSGRKERAA